MVSPAGWVEAPSGGQHATSATQTYIDNGVSPSCAECHGANLSGGTAKVSCFDNPAGCHHGQVAGWVAASPVTQKHGAAAKRPLDGSGLASCEICHGSDFFGGGSQTSCFTSTCHAVNAPHPAQPWRGPTYTHTDTDTSNAPVCARCHSQGSLNNPANHPATPAPPGTAPGCFNSTLCHGETPVPHPVDNAWVAARPAAQPHGDSAKAVASITAGFAYCRACHGSGAEFAGGVSGVSCYPCHGVDAPHSPKPWRGSPYTHTTMAGEGNSPVCYTCHAYSGTANPNNPHAPPSPASAGTTPGCFNGTMCHNQIGHAVPYNIAAHFTATVNSFTANCGNCHAVTGSSPVSSAAPCTTCHTAGSPLTALNCTSCHASPPDGATTAYPNVAGAHASHTVLNAIVCDTCHNGLGTETLDHYNRANARTGMDALRAAPGDVVFLAGYNAQSGAAAFTAASRTCSNVICHGGQATPDWQTATADAIDVPNACLECHVSGTTQYNSYYTGQHTFHIGRFGLNASTCKLCHDVTKVNVSGHFDNLSTTGFEQSPAATILPAVRYINGSCNPRAGGLPVATGQRTGEHGRNTSTVCG